MTKKFDYKKWVLENKWGVVNERVHKPKTHSTIDDDPNREKTGRSTEPTDPCHNIICEPWQECIDGHCQGMGKEIDPRDLGTGPTDPGVPKGANLGERKKLGKKNLLNLIKKEVVKLRENQMALNEIEPCGEGACPSCTAGEDCYCGYGGPFGNQQQVGNKGSWHCTDGCSCVGLAPTTQLQKN
jgi:hypothetical protein